MFEQANSLDVEILQAPKCPNVKVIRLVKTSPFNFNLRFYMRSHLRNQNVQYGLVYFLVGQTDSTDKIQGSKLTFFIT